MAYPILAYPPAPGVRDRTLGGPLRIELGQRGRRRAGGRGHERRLAPGEHRVARVAPEVRGLHEARRQVLRARRVVALERLVLVRARVLVAGPRVRHHTEDLAALE